VYQPLRSPTSPLRVAKPINHVWKLRSTAFHGAVFCPLVFSTAFFGRPARSASTIFPRKPKTSSQVHSPPPASSAIVLQADSARNKCKHGHKKAEKLPQLGLHNLDSSIYGQEPGALLFATICVRAPTPFPTCNLIIITPSACQCPSESVKRELQEAGIP